jgi:hypothetical protein
MTALAATAPATPLERALSVYRDDGPLARALGRALGPRLRVPAPLAMLVAVVPLLAAIAIWGDGAPAGVTAAVLAWLLLAGGTAAGRPHGDRMGWAGPPLACLGEYAAILWIAVLAGPASLPAAFALLSALTFRHYDLAYRLRHRGVTPAPWVNALSGGWDGRVVVALLLLAAGALPAGYFVAAAVLGIAFAAEAAAGWMIEGRIERPNGYENEEDEGQ